MASEKKKNQELHLANHGLKAFSPTAILLNFGNACNHHVNKFTSQTSNVIEEAELCLTL